MAKGYCRTAPWMVVFDGQSLNNVPAAATTYGAKLMAGRSAPFWRSAVNGTSWTDLAVTVGLRTSPLAKCATNTVAVLCGGQSDIWGGDTGAQVYADEVAYAATLRSAGFDYVVAMTMVPNTVNTAGQNTARTDHNTLLLADASQAFDHVFDIAGIAALQNAADTTYYGDGVHWTSAATTLVAADMDSYFDSLQASLAP